MRSSYTFPNKGALTDDRLLAFTNEFRYSSILMSNNVKNDLYSSYETIVAVGATKILSSEKDSFKKLRKFHSEYKDWMFGFLSYELKNEIDNLDSDNISNINIPNLFFYIPETVLLFSKDIITVHSSLSELEVKEMLNRIEGLELGDNLGAPVALNFRESKDDYLQKISKIKDHIQQGDIYEMNYCQELYNDAANINPQTIFSDLNKKAQAPFSVFFKYQDIYLLCSSPERFLKKINNKIISQPIKGTRRRSQDLEEDIQLIDDLKKSDKERSENIMITDLVRNDLSRTAKKSSVLVEELCKIYTFDQVHQMISTVSSELATKYDFIDLLESTFPMGSMTGAPKIKSMELIEEYETTKRSLFSSSFGYITPESDFDFNVVIRSIVYDKIQQFVSVMIGSAITINSDPLEEYEECMIKAKAMINALKYE